MGVAASHGAADPSDFAAGAVVRCAAAYAHRVLSLACGPLWLRRSRSKTDELGYHSPCLDPLLVPDRALPVSESHNSAIRCWCSAQLSLLRYSCTIRMRRCAPL